MAPLWLHAYSGRENGLMVIGDRDAMQALGRQLLDEKFTNELTASGWPPQIACPAVVGPYGDVHDFKLSFHIKGDRELEEIVPIRRRVLRLPMIVGFSVCAIVGAATIGRWIVHVL
jgi:hypothetical protein